MSESCPLFEDTLHYSSSAHGGWGVVRTAMLVPESYQLFVSPFACGRHGAIGAYYQGIKDRLSYLYLQEEDIVSGSYEAQIPEAVDELFTALPKYPRALLIFVSCLDDLLGTDHEAILATLRKRYPKVAFIFCHMNPISLGSEVPPPVGVQLNMYRLLASNDLPKQAAINFIGNMVPVNKDSEVYSVLQQMGIMSVRHISDYDHFDSWQEMAQSCLNVVLLPPGRKAAQDMQARLAIPYLDLPVTYDPDEVKEAYAQLAKALGRDEVPDLTTYYNEAVACLRETANDLRDVKIVLDGAATTKPFGLALTLLKYGFTVTEVMADDAGADAQNLQRLQMEHPEIVISQPQHHKTVLYERRQPDVLAVGFDAGYITGAHHVAGLVNDEGMFGFWGINKLMQMLRTAWNEESDLEEMINNYGLVI